MVGPLNAADAGVVKTVLDRSPAVIIALTPIFITWLDMEGSLKLHSVVAECAL
jgi:hypothetical protein